MEGLEFVDVFAVLASLEVFTLCRPLDGILGAYTSADGGGVLVTTKRRLPIQRFTAAHELGHYWLKHEQSIDSEKSIGLARAGKGVALQEIEAEAFASELLLPRNLLIMQAKRRKWGRKDLEDPDNVYQLSLRTSTSYEATWRALLENRLISPKAAENIGKIEPGKSKARVLQNIQADNSWADAFKLSKVDTGTRVLASPDDTILIELPEHSSSGYLWTDLGRAGLGIQLLGDGSGYESGNCLGAIGSRKLYFRGEGPVTIHMEERRPWQTEGKPIATFDVDIDFSGQELGLPRAMRQ
ncbi:MAG: ImmA/IrrE family metallo-endopeptidase [Candidatus Thiodiazotropha sp.]